MTTPTPTLTPVKAGRAERASNGLLVLIVLAVGLMAASASFRHVHDWTMHNSPADTADWFGWANAVITELIPTAALIIIAKRRRSGTPIGYPMFLLVVAVALSLTAQLAVARPTVFGWMVSALPALAFFALSKLVFSQTKHAPTPTATPAAAAAASVGSAVLDELTARIAYLETRPTPKVPARKPATPARASSTDTATGKAHPVADPTTRAPRTPRKRTTPATPPATATPDPTPTPAPAVVAVLDVPGTAPTPAVGSVDLLPTARLYAESHQRTHGEPITVGQLATRMHISTTAAQRLLRAVNGLPDYTDAPTTTAPHNGSRPLLDVTA